MLEIAHDSLLAAGAGGTYDFTMLGEFTDDWDVNEIGWDELLAKDHDGLLAKLCVLGPDRAQVVRDGRFISAAVLDLKGGLQVPKLRMAFVKESPPEKIVRSLPSLASNTSEKSWSRCDAGP